MIEETNLDVQIGRRIQKLREQNKLTRLQLAKILGYESETAIYLIEAGKRGLAPDKLSIVATRFKISVDELMGKEPKDIHLRTALRSDKKLTEQDMDQVEKFVEFLKNYPQNK